MRAFGFDCRLRAPEQLISVEDYRRAARRRLPRMVWTYVDGGADDLHAVRGNREAYDRWWLTPNVLTGHAKHDLSTEVAGLDLSMPVMLAPTGLTGLSHWTGDVAAARAANKHGTAYALSTVSSYSVEEVARAAAGPHVFQLYPGHQGLAASLLRRAWAAGYRTLFVTVDVPILGNREGERKEGLEALPVLTPRRALNFASRPQWTYDALVHQRMGGRSLVSGGTVAEAVKSVQIQDRELIQATLDWDDVAWMRDHWPGRMYLKGILRVDDAERAVQYGLDGVVVSNHGGRQLEYSIPTLDALPPIAEAIGDRAEIILDGGIRRGTDVVKAIALGADAVLIGRPYVYGLATAGQRGVEGVLAILREEIDRALTLLGVAGIRDVNRSHLIPAP